MAPKTRVNRAEPMPGAFVLGVTNLKPQIGRMNLGRQVPMTREIIGAFRDAGLKAELAGASALGVTIPVSEMYMRSRTVSSVVDVFVDGSRGRAKQIARDMGFRRVPAEEIFSLTFDNGDGIKTTSATVAGQMRFNGNLRMPGMELMVTFVPTEYARIRQGRHAGPTVEIMKYDRMPTPGSILLEKLIRGTEKDVADVSAAAAVADLGKLVRPHDMAAFLDMIEGRAARSGWLSSLVGRIEQVDRNVAWYVGEYNKAAPQGSVDFLATLRRMAESLRAKQ